MTFQMTPLIDKNKSATNEQVSVIRAAIERLSSTTNLLLVRIALIRHSILDIPEFHAFQEGGRVGLVLTILFFFPLFLRKPKSEI